MNHRASEPASAVIGHPGTESAYRKMKTEMDALNALSLASIAEFWWCNSHQRRATHVRERDQYHCCDPKLGGIMIPCECVLR